MGITVRRMCGEVVIGGRGESHGGGDVGRKIEEKESLLK